MTGIHIWPVIHVLDDEQALNNAQLAHSAGVEGIFLIQMEGRDHLLDPVGHHIRKALPGLKVGVNYLSMSAMGGLEHGLAQGWDASWSDNPGVRSDEVTPQAQAIAILLRNAPQHLYFGSVAFKYQPKDPHPGEAARLALALGMIPTTSGEATGSAPAKEKLAHIRSAVGRGALAVASGITPENIAMLGPYLTHALVATGIGKDFHHLCPDKLSRLIEAAKACQRDSLLCDPSLLG